MPRRQQLLKYLRKSSFSCSLSLAKLEYEKWNCPRYLYT
jgi:hypothetical protein